MQLENSKLDDVRTLQPFDDERRFAWMGQSSSNNQVIGFSFSWVGVVIQM